MKFHPLPLSGVIQIEGEPRLDHRGSFARTYDEEIFASAGIARTWVQENQSYSSRKHTIRGLHFQLPPYNEEKLVRVARGEILDVIVDLRKDSPTYGEHTAIVLSASNSLQLFIPTGMAHGICTLTDHVVVCYKVTAPYVATHDCGVRWNDPELRIAWPTSEVTISDKDKGLSLFRDFNSPFTIKT